MIKTSYIIFFIVIVLLNFKAAAQFMDTYTKGQFISGLTINPEDPFQSQLGLQYFPSLLFNKKINDTYQFDWEFTLKTNATYFWSNDSNDLNAQLKPYRGWVSFSGNQLDLRAGLHKINFGSASLLRPLMWFDKIDPRDPIQMTDGVHALLGRYYFLNNANIWLWFLYGNDETKGWEIFPSGKEQSEMGGRIQMPLLTGEIAATYHYREGLFKGTYADTLSNRSGFSENRYAIDGKFDFKIGMWFETALIHQNLDFTNQRYQRLTNLGADYTFGIGNGLGIVAEYFTYKKTEEVFGKGEGVEFVAASINYPINLINNLQAILYYDITNNDYYRFVNFSWTYDNWVIYVMGFWNPDNYQIYQNMGNTNLFSGYGAQIMVVFNH
ncbi:MAG: hypothetical protein U9P82_07345 [Bacteroidota bacterium]|nr:hypothetical protein [Bacteroidota bacterium]